MLKPVKFRASRAPIFLRVLETPGVPAHRAAESGPVLPARSCGLPVGWRQSNVSHSS
jgi:hypothetical protein